MLEIHAASPMAIVKVRAVNRECKLDVLPMDAVRLIQAQGRAWWAPVVLHTLLANRVIAASTSAMSSLRALCIFTMPAHWWP